MRSFFGTVSPKSKEDPKTSVETQSAPKKKAATTSKSQATTPTQQRYPDAACQTADHHFLFGTHLTKSVTRSLTNLTEGDPNRANLGVGTICIKETYMGLGASSKITCQLHVDGELKLQTFFPEKKMHTNTCGSIMKRRTLWSGMPSIRQSQKQSAADSPSPLIVGLRCFPSWSTDFVVTLIW